MKLFYTLTLTAFIALFLSACQQELHFPEVKPDSKFTVVADGITYNLKVDFQNLQVGDTSQLRLSASSSDYTVIINAKSGAHINGVGEYFLWCCSNDAFEYITGTRKHWEGDHIGNSRQSGFVKVTRMDEGGFAGTYFLSAKDGSGRNAARKEFTGTFEIYY